MLSILTRTVICATSSSNRLKEPHVSELRPNRMWTIFQPNGDREGHDGSHGLPQAQAGGNMQIRDKRLTHRSLFDSVGIGEPAGETLATHRRDRESVSASPGGIAAAVRMARDPDANVDEGSKARLAERTRIAQELHDTL